MNTRNLLVKSPVGETVLDSGGSPIGAVRLDCTRSYSGVWPLLQNYIDGGSESTWQEIKEKIDYTCLCMGDALAALERKAPYQREITSRVRAGQKLLFKPNLVVPRVIDHITHGLDRNAACTAWPFVAALMRWFHDRLDVTYHEMCLAEGASATSATAALYSQHAGRQITTLAVIEGKDGDFYGGWGFYFVRKYLDETHTPGHTDDPMRGYEDSLAGNCLPPGLVRDRLLVYDLNKVDADLSNGREIPVPGGVNYDTITLHKAIIGGDPADAKDRRAWPGSVIINMPKLKVHGIELLTNAVKNLGIGLYPAELNTSRDPDKPLWKYAFPHRRDPGGKYGLPHQVWVMSLDTETSLPLKDSNSQYIIAKTGGLVATMCDVNMAVRNDGVYLLHVVDSIETGNAPDPSSGAVWVTVASTREGFVFASTDPVALDVLCGRYMFSTVPMAKARAIQKERHLPSEFFRRVPVPVYDGRNIVTYEGYDSPVSRYFAYQTFEKRGLGSQEYYVTGKDRRDGGNLASLDGRLGRVKNGRFDELITPFFYVAGGKLLYDMQATALAYADANDLLSGSTIRRSLMEALDENGDGVIDYEERGRGGWRSNGLAGIRDAAKLSQEDTLRLAFLFAAMPLRLLRKEWNSRGEESGIGGDFNRSVGIAYAMSRQAKEMPDPFFPALTWGAGKWPSFQLVRYRQICAAIYGPQAPANSGPNSLYGLVSRYAALTQSGGTPSKGSFTLYVPAGYEKVNGQAISNVTETNDPALIFTAGFSSGEKWQELSL